MLVYIKQEIFLIHDDTIYLSAVTKENDCQFIKIYKSKIDFENLDLTEVFQKEFCNKDLNIQAGRIEIFEDVNLDMKILLSTNTDETFNQSMKNYLSLAQRMILWKNNFYRSSVRNL